MVSICELDNAFGAPVESLASSLYNFKQFIPTLLSTSMNVVSILSPDQRCKNRRDENMCAIGNKWTSSTIFVAEIGCLIPNASTNADT